MKSRAPRGVVSLPLVVLVDETTQGGELLAAAVQRNHRGVVVGRRTSGRSSAKTKVKGADGTARMAETGVFLMDPDRPISGRGIEPDKALPAGATPEELVRAAAAELSTLIASGGAAP